MASRSRGSRAAAPAPTRTMWLRRGVVFLLVASAACFGVLWWFAAGEPEQLLRPVRSAVALALGS